MQVENPNILHDLKAPASLDNLIRVVGFGGARCGTSYLSQLLLSERVVTNAGVKEHHFYDSYFKFRLSKKINGWSNEQIDQVGLRQVKGELAEEVRSHRSLMLDDPQHYWQQYLEYINLPESNYSHIIDITPQYGLLPVDCLKMIIESHPKTRGILLLRDPIDRFWSGLKKRSPEIDLSIDDIYTKEIEGMKAGNVRIQARKSQMGTILKNVRMAFNELGKIDSLHVVIHDDLFGEKQMETLKSIFTFLGLPGDNIEDKADNRVNVTNDEKIPDDKWKELRPYFEKEYQLCFSIIGDNKMPGSWKS